MCPVRVRTRHEFLNAWLFSACRLTCVAKRLLKNTLSNSYRCLYSEQCSTSFSASFQSMSRVLRRRIDSVLLSACCCLCTSGLFKVTTEWQWKVPGLSGGFVWVRFYYFYRLMRSRLWLLCLDWIAVYGLGDLGEAARVVYCLLKIENQAGMRRCLSVPTYYLFMANEYHYDMEPFES